MLNRELRIISSYMLKIHIYFLVLVCQACSLQNYVRILIALLSTNSKVITL